MFSLGAMMTELTGIGTREGFNGTLIAVNETPPLILPFSFAPEEYRGNWSPQWEFVGAPASRYKFPIYSGMGGRTIEFTVKFDADYPSVHPGELFPDELDDEADSDACSTTACSTRSVKRKGTLKKSAWRYAWISSRMALIEKMKTPRDANKIAQSPFSLLHVAPDVAEPSPPLILFAKSIDKFYLGYLDAVIRETMHNRYMVCTQFEADCTLYVAPDCIFTTLDQVYRYLMAIYGTYASPVIRGFAKG